MNRISYCALIIALFLAQNAYSQLVINRSLYESMRGHTMTQTTYQIEAENVPVEALGTILEIKGENKIFDFSFLNVPESSILVTKSYVLNTGEEHPFSEDERLEGVNYITKIEFMNELIDVAYSFMILTDDSVKTVATGFVNPETGDKDITFFDEMGINTSEPLPQTYGTSWTEEMDMGFAKFIDYYSYDAWGTLKVPGGATASTLRTLSETEVTTTIPLPGLSQERRPESYNYITFDDLNVSVAVYYDEETGEFDYFEVFVSRSGNAQTSIGRDRVDLPEGFSLSQNYPNPFNPSTNIDFSLPFTADATIRVYDLTGRIVASINMPGTTAGQHSVQFDASKLSSGVYLYRLEAGGFTTAKMFTLVK